MKKIYLYLFFITLFYQNNLSAQLVALNFDGTNDYVQTTYAGVSGSADRTIEAWIRTTANCNPSAGGSQKVIADYGTFINGQRFTFNLLWSNAIRLEVGGNGISGTTPVNDGLWHHVAVTFKGNSNYVNLYTDGVLDGQGVLTVTANTGTVNNLMIGKRVDGVNLFDGDIDEVRFYNYAKTAAEIVAAKNSELCNIPAGLVGYWKLNEGIPGGSNSSNTSAADYSGNNNSGTLNGFALTGATSNWVQSSLPGSASTSSSITGSGCTSYTSPSGKVWTTSGVYMDTIPNSTGCDSLITVNLSINSSNTITTVTTCDTYTDVNGMTYTASGFYANTYTNVAGCDSTVTLDLTINNSATGTAVIAACDSAFVDGNWYFTSQTVTAMYNTNAGCDSTVTVNVQITAIDTGVTVVDGTGTANETAADSYAWIDCTTQLPVTGATSSTFTTSVTGSYAVIVTKNGCADTSECVTIFPVGVSDIQKTTTFQIIPNPNNGQFSVRLEDAGEAYSYVIYDAVGQIVANKTVQTNNQFTVNENLSTGIYFLIVDTAKGRLMQKMMVD